MLVTVVTVASVLQVAIAPVSPGQAKDTGAIVVTLMLQAINIELNNFPRSLD